MVDDVATTTGTGDEDPRIPPVHFAPPSSAMYERRDDLTLCGRPTSSLPRTQYTTDSERCNVLFGQPHGVHVCERCLEEWRRVGFCYYEPDIDDLPRD